MITIYNYAFMIMSGDLKGDYVRVMQPSSVTANDRRVFIKAVYKNDIGILQRLIRRDLIDAFVKTRKGTNVNPLYIAIQM